MTKKAIEPPSLRKSGTTKPRKLLGNLVYEYPQSLFPTDENYQNYRNHCYSAPPQFIGTNTDCATIVTVFWSPLIFSISSLLLPASSA